MSALPAEKLREPEELYEPFEFSEDMVTKLLSVLSAEDGRRFAADVFQAINRARREGDLRPINLAIESWWRTMAFKTRARFEELWSEAPDESALSIEDIRQRRAQRHR